MHFPPFTLKSTLPFLQNVLLSPMGVGRFSYMAPNPSGGSPLGGDHVHTETHPGNVPPGEKGNVFLSSFFSSACLIPLVLESRIMFQYQYRFLHTVELK